MKSGGAAGDVEYKSRTPVRQDDQVAPLSRPSTTIRPNSSCLSV
jgi:hypothetical protein